MRKRNIKTVAHWVIMSILLLFPILMVGVSSFANVEQTVIVTETYEYETNEIHSYNDFVVGNIYKCNFFDFYNSQLSLNVSYFKNSVLEISNFDEEEITIWLYTDDQNYYLAESLQYEVDFYTGGSDFYFVPSSINNITIPANETWEQNFSASDYLGEITTDVDIQNATYKQEINNWCNGFKNLPVNQWYGQLLNVIGVGQTTNSVMNVIYVYPLYVLWVYLIDLIVDCLLVIIHFGHNALSRLGGDND